MLLKNFNLFQIAQFERNKQHRWVRKIQILNFGGQFNKNELTESEYFDSESSGTMYLKPEIFHGETSPNSQS